MMIVFLMTRRGWGKPGRLKISADTYEPSLGCVLAILEQGWTLQAALDGRTIKEIAAPVEEVFEERASSAETIARTEIVSPSNFGNHEAALQAGMSWKSWISSQDKRVRDEHLEMDKLTSTERISITEPFILTDQDHSQLSRGRLSRQTGRGQAASGLGKRAVENTAPSEGGIDPVGRAWAAGG